MADFNLQCTNKKQHASFSEEDIKWLQQIHLEHTGVLLTIQETIEMGIRIKESLRMTYKVIPA